VAPPGIPQSTSFAWNVAARALEEQLRRVEALDAKAATLMAADLILAGFIIAGSDRSDHTPPLVLAAAGLGLVLSLSTAVGAFAVRRCEMAPTPSVVADLAEAPEDWIRWRLMGNMLGAIETNRNKLARKTRWLSLSQGILLVAITPFGAYFVWQQFVGVG
jgi:hypothetical protein